jgi:hypothetical protein
LGDDGKEISTSFRDHFTIVESRPSKINSRRRHGTGDRSSLDDDELAIASVSVAEYRR